MSMKVKAMQHYEIQTGVGVEGLFTISKHHMHKTYVLTENVNTAK